MMNAAETFSSRIEHLHRRLVDCIPCFPDSELVRGQLRAKGLSDLISTYMNWVDRLIPPRPRKTMVWNGFWLRNAPSAHAEAIDGLIQSLSDGEDMTPYLSRYALSHGFEPPRERKGIQWQGRDKGHKDFALNAYDLHHLHLRPSDNSGRHPGGSRELLYVGVSREEALLLMLGDHRSFDDGTLLQAVTEHRALSGWDLRGVAGITPEFTNLEATSLLRNGVNTAKETRGKVVMVSTLSSAGTSIDHTRWADRVCLFLDEYDPKLEDELLRSSWNDLYGIPQTAILNWNFHYGDFGVIDEETETMWILLRWKR